MRRPAVLSMASWMLSRFVPMADRESLLGDLAEEHASRAASQSTAAASRWLLRQIGASIPPLLWSGLRRAAWPATLGVALLGYVAIAVMQLCIHWALGQSATYGAQPLLIVAPMVAVVGYLADRWRRRAALVLAVMMLLAMTAMTVWTTEDAPLWYRAAYFLVGPAAAVIGGALRAVNPFPFHKAQ